MGVRVTWREFSLEVTDDLIATFMSQVDTTDPTGCHLWTGRKINSFGHGDFYVSKRGHHPAHRVAWVIAHRQPIPPRMVVRHLCHVPSCVNPDHLDIGTVQQNVDDKCQAGRLPIGEAHYAAKLTEADVLAIRDRYRSGEPVYLLADEYGVTTSRVTQIVAGKGWEHVTGGSRVIPTVTPPRRPRSLDSFHRGSGHARSVHTEESVTALHTTVKSGVPIAQAARMHGFSESSARQIMSGRSWSHVTGITPPTHRKES